MLRRRRSSLLAGAAMVFVAGTADAQPSAEDRLQIAYALKADHALERAARAFDDARVAGASEQLVELELGYLAAAGGDADGARRHYARAARGDDEGLARRARAEIEVLARPVAPPAKPPGAPPANAAAPSRAALEAAYRAKSAGDHRGAALAFARARDEGAPPQLVAMELGYAAHASGADDEAHAHFLEAQRGPDPELADRARREGAALPKHVSADAYADAFTWSRVSGPSNGSAIVPTVRARVFYQPWLNVPLDVYASAQATRDTASRGASAGVLPQIYADNYAVLGAGARLRLFRNAVALFVQAGPAFDLLDDGRSSVVLDARAGAVAYVETSGCAPAAGGVRAGLWPCLEAYGEAVYASRFRDNVIAFARPRAAMGYLVLGPVLWQMVGEARAAKDRNNDYWNNLADAGIGHRWRLLAPLRVDLVVTADAGSHFGLAGRDPAPSRLGYVDLRAALATFVEF